MAKVGSDRHERDWLWKTFGEYHHVDFANSRDRLVHDLDDLSPSEIYEEINEAMQWLAELAVKIRRTQASVPDTTGHSSAIFPTSMFAELPGIEDEDASAENSVVLIGLEPDFKKPHPLRFDFISFDPSTETMTFHGFEDSEITLLGR